MAKPLRNGMQYTGGQSDCAIPHASVGHSRDGQPQCNEHAYTRATGSEDMSMAATQSLLYSSMSMSMLSSLPSLSLSLPF